MYKKIGFIYTCLVGLSVQAHVEKEKLSCVQKIIKKIHKLTDRDIGTFKTWNAQFDQLDQDIHRCQEERRILVHGLHATFDEITHQFNVTQQQCAQMLYEKDLTIQDLEEQLTAVKDEAQKEISQLQEKIGLLDAQLDRMKEKYDAAVSMYEENIDDLVEELLRVKDRYVLLVKSREEFLARLVSSMHNVNAYLASVSADNRELGAHILGPKFIQELDALFQNSVNVSNEYKECAEEE